MNIDCLWVWLIIADSKSVAFKSFRGLVDLTIEEQATTLTQGTRTLYSSAYSFALPQFAYSLPTLCLLFAYSLPALCLLFAHCLHTLCLLLTLSQFANLSILSICNKSVCRKGTAGLLGHSERIRPRRGMASFHYVFLLQ